MSPITTQSLKPARDTPYPAVFEDYEKKRDQLERWARRHYIDEFALTPGMRLLDAGCGEGFWSSIFDRAGLIVSGFDLCFDYVRAGQTKYPNVALRVGDAAEKKLYPAGSFDVVFCRAISHFYAESLDGAEEVLTNLKTYVKTNGFLLLSMYSDQSGKARPGVYGNLATHHPADAFLRTVESAGCSIVKTARVGNYLQVQAVGR